MGNALTAMASEIELSTDRSPLFSDPALVCCGLTWLVTGALSGWPSVPSFSEGADMTMILDNALGPPFKTELISAAPLLLLTPNEAPAPTAKLSIAKRNAVLACAKADG